MARFTCYPKLKYIPKINHARKTIPTGKRYPPRIYLVVWPVAAENAKTPTAKMYRSRIKTIMLVNIWMTGSRDAYSIKSNITGASPKLAIIEIRINTSLY